MTGRKRLIPLGVALLLGLLFVWALGRENPQAVTSPLVGRPVPTFALKGLDPQHPGLTDADLRQGTVTVVNFFASWCAPCIAELPQLKRLADQGVVVHAIVHKDTNVAAIQALLRRSGEPFRRVGMSADGAESIAWGVRGLPESFIVRGDGVVHAHHWGDIRADAVPDLLAQVAEARRVGKGGTP